MGGDPQTGVRRAAEFFRSSGLSGKSNSQISKESDSGMTVFLGEDTRIPLENLNFYVTKRCAGDKASRTIRCSRCNAKRWEAHVTECTFCFLVGTRGDRKGVLRSNGRALCRIRRSVRLRSRTLGTGTACEGLSERLGQSPRISQVFLSENAGAFFYLRE